MFKPEQKTTMPLGSAARYKKT